MQVLALVAWLRPLEATLVVIMLIAPLLQRPRESSWIQLPSSRLTTPFMIWSVTTAPAISAPRSLYSSTRSPLLMPLAAASSTLMRTCWRPFTFSYLRTSAWAIWLCTRLKGCGLTTCTWPALALPRYSAGSRNFGIGGQSGTLKLAISSQYSSILPDLVCSGLLTGSV